MAGIFCLLNEITSFLECLRCIKLEKPNRQAKNRIDKAPEWTVFTNRGNIQAVPLVTDFACFCERLGKAFQILYEETTKNVELLNSSDSDFTPNQFLLRYVKFFLIIVLIKFVVIVYNLFLTQAVIWRL